MSNEDQNPERPSKPSEDALSRALEELMEGRSSRAEAPLEDEAGAPTPGSEDGCPEPEEWLMLLSGEARPEEEKKAAALLAHAAECSNCSARLRMLSAEASEEEAAEVGKLASSTRDWQHKLAVELAHTPHQTAHKT